MSDPQGNPWSDNPNAPKVPRVLYLDEKASFAGLLISSIFYGMIIVLFFKCMTALFDPDNRRGDRVKWWLVSYTAIMFSAATVQTGMNLDILSISYIDDREFPGINGVLPPGPWGYQVAISPTALSVIPSAMLTLCNWLADGLLLYRCYVIYSKNLWATAFPCLMFLGSLVTGTILVYQSSKLTAKVWSALPYFSISLSLNILLTLMIVIRLILHTRNIRAAMGIAGSGRLSKAIVTMLIESCALYSVNSLLFIAPWGAHNYAESIFLPILTQTQVIAPLLVIQRVADKSALTSNTVASGHLSDFKAGSRGQLTAGSDALPSENPVSSVGEHEVNSGELGVETIVDSHRED